MIRQHYPRAWQHLQNAMRTRGEMVRAWNAALDDHLVDEMVVTDRDGTGRIIVYADWPPGRRDELTDQFRACIDELWQCLDLLVVETVETFSIRQRARNPDRPRFFPVADSPDGYAALLEESCLDGVLVDQAQLVHGCQPFHSRLGVDWIDRLRDGIRQLLAWSGTLDDGGRISAWATPVDPQIHAEQPVIAEHVEAAEPGEITTERVVARYQLRNYRPGFDVAGQSGTYIDICLGHDRAPAQVDDTFAQRLTEVIDAVAQIAGAFAVIANRIPGPRRIPTHDRRDATDTWILATQSPRRWTDDELAGLAASDIGLGRVIDADEVTLIVTTSEGVYERRIPNATGLRHHDRRGTAAEQAVQDAAATWGLPDFVIPPSVERKGSGVREISDGLLVVGKRGIIMQTKARDANLRNPAREAAWLDKQIGRAVRQINGTARRLRDGGVDMKNGRGHRVHVDGRSIDWSGVVIIDHPDPPDDHATPAAGGGDVPYVVLLRRDWEFLFDQLRSTYAVVSYLRRVEGSTDKLGTEPERYYELAAADAAAPPSPFDPALEGVGEARSVPLLPVAPAGIDDDAHSIVRIILEDIATTDIEPGRHASRLSVLATIDSLPVAYRAELGHLLIEALTASQHTESDTVFWRFRTYLAGADRDQLGFGVCSVFNETIRRRLRSVATTTPPRTHQPERHDRPHVSRCAPHTPPRRPPRVGHHHGRHSRRPRAHGR